MAPFASFALTPALPVINTNNVINVLNYGALGDGTTDNTAAISNAISTAASGGTTNGAAGGVVEIPSGVFLCGPIVLKNAVNLQIDPGAILRLLPIDRYPGGTNIGTTFISGSKLQDIAVTGGGAIDGQGAAWWPYASVSGALRPRMFSPANCNRVLVQNITMSNSPMFHIAISGGGNITVKGVTVFAPGDSPNTDACDITGTNIVVQDCNISVGDDDYTCGGNTHDVLLTNNVYGTGHGVSIGSYTTGGVSNITVINCTFNGTANGIRLKSQRDRGGLIQNLNYLNLTMTNVDWPFLIYSYYEYGLGTITGVTPMFAANVAATNNAITSTMPFWRNITFSNITAVTTAARPPLMLWGLPQLAVSNVTFVRVNLSANRSPAIYNATNIQFIDCALKLPANTNLLLYNASVTFSNSAPSTNIVRFDGVTTNGVGNALQLFNISASLKNTNVFDTAPLTLGGAALAVSNNLALTGAGPLTFALGTNAAQINVASNLALGGGIIITAGAGFTNGTYTLFNYGKTLTWNSPTVASAPAGYNYAFDTGTAGLIKLLVTLPAPSAPTNLTASATNALVALRWYAVSGATSYNLKRSLTNGGSYALLAGGLTATNYTDTAVTNGVTYYYVVSAVNGGGESTNSLQVSATPQPSLTPVIVAAQVNAGQLQLSWPADHTGWRLQTQTNSLTTGLGTNWVDVPGSSQTNQVNLPVNPETPGAFFRLTY